MNVTERLLAIAIDELFEAVREHQSSLYYAEEEKRYRALSIIAAAARDTALGVIDELGVNLEAVLAEVRGHTDPRGNVFKHRNADGALSGGTVHVKQLRALLEHRSRRAQSDRA